jgi:alpha-beta hydrolase superfamily lysophospholipase
MTGRREEGTLVRQRTPGPALYAHCVAPDGPPKLVAGVIHGFADHGARYAHVLDLWAERGVASVALDMRGHGRAEGPRGYCERFGDYLDDVAELVHRVDSWAPGVPAFLFGHSFGGLVAAMAASEHPGWWRGLILSSPFFDLAVKPPVVKLLAGRLAGRVVPRLGLPSDLRGKDMTHDPEQARAYDEDPFIFKQVRSGWFVETEKAQARVFERAPSLSMPLYVLVGGNDPVAKVEAARHFFDVAGSSDKTWDLRPGLYHEVLNEPEWQAPAARLADFMLTRATA